MALVSDSLAVITNTMKGLVRTATIPAMGVLGLVTECARPVKQAYYGMRVIIHASNLVTLKMESSKWRVFANGVILLAKHAQGEVRISVQHARGHCSSRMGLLVLESAERELSLMEGIIPVKNVISLVVLVRMLRMRDACLVMRASFWKETAALTPAPREKETLSLANVSPLLTVEPGKRWLTGCVMTVRKTARTARIL